MAESENQPTVVTQEHKARVARAQARAAKQQAKEANAAAKVGKLEAKRAKVEAKLASATARQEKVAANRIHAEEAVQLANEGMKRSILPWKWGRVVQVRASPRAHAYLRSQPNRVPVGVARIPEGARGTRHREGKIEDY